MWVCVGDVKPPVLLLKSLLKAAGMCPVLCLLCCRCWSVSLTGLCNRTELLAVCSVTGGKCARAVSYVAVAIDCILQLQWTLLATHLAFYFLVIYFQANLWKGNQTLVKVLISWPYWADYRCKRRNCVNVISIFLTKTQVTDQWVFTKDKRKDSQRKSH